MQQQGSLDEAMSLADRAVELDPTFAKAHLNRANLYKLKRMNAEAIAGYETALRLRPDYPEAYNNLAVLLTDMDEPDAAVEYCRKGLALEPTSAALMANLATALQNLGLRRRGDRRPPASRSSCGPRASASTRICCTS